MSEVRYSTTTPGITKLKGSSNYGTWKMDMRGALKRDGLWSAIEPRAGTSSEDEEVKSLRDERAYGSIFVHLESGPKLHIGECLTAKEAWDTLNKQYEAKTTIRRCFLLDQLLNVKLIKCSSIEDYLDKFLDISTQLASIGKPVDDEMKACLLLIGMPESYEPFKMSVENSSDFSYDSVLKKLTDMAEKEALERSTASSSGAAFYSNKGGGQNPKKKKFIPKCFKCHEPGHFIKDCPKKGKSTGGDGGGGMSANLSKSNKPVSWITALSTKVESQGWYLDSCCTDNLSKDKSNFKSLDDKVNNKNVTVADNSTIKTAGLGQAVVNLKGFGQRTISDVTYVPKLSANLLSVGKLAEKNQVLVFDKFGCKIFDVNDFCVKGTVTGTGTLVNGLYKLDTVETVNCNKATVEETPKVVMSTKTVTVNSSSSVEPQFLWHKRLGHLNAKSMRVLKNKLATGICFPDSELKKCLPCVKGKKSQRTFNSLESTKRAEAKLELVHSDVCGPMRVESFQRNLYFVTFTDDYSRMTFCYFIKSKDEVAECFDEFNTLMKNQNRGWTVKKVRTDGGGEYVGQSFQNVCKKFGVIHDITSRYSPSQNGVSERLNRTLCEKARTMMFEANLSKAYWQYAIDVAVYLKNRSPTRSVFGATPFEKWTGSKIDLSHLRVFGCMAQILMPSERRDKLDPKTQTVVFVGYCPTSKNYKFVELSCPRRIIVSTSVSFFENRFKKGGDDSEFCELGDDGNDGENIVNPEPEPVETIVTVTPIVKRPEEIVDDDDVPLNRLDNESLEGAEEEEVTPDSDSEGEDNEEDIEVNVGGRYPVRYRKQKQFPDFVCFSVSVDDQEPNTFKAAMSSANKNLWKKAVKDELDALERNQTWDLVDLPAGKNLVQSKWVFKIKRDENGQAVKFKARLVAKGFTQRHGIDYNETFSPVVRFECLRLLFALSVKFDWSIHHLDVTCAFLASDLDEEIYMAQPEGNNKKTDGKVCKLKKAIYGLKQASRAWNDRCNAVLSMLGFSPLVLEPCVYVYFSNGEFALIALYVDDFLLFSSCDKLRDTIKERLGESFDIKDLGEAKNVLGMRIQRGADGSLTLDQSAYTEKILKKYKLWSANSSSTPMEEGLDPQKPDSCEEGLDFQGIIGSLMYLAVCTRPDISFSVTKLSQYNTAHNEEIFKYAKRVLRYLKGTQSLGLRYSADNITYLHGYVDASHGNNFDGKSFSGYVFMLSGGPVAWGSRKQRLVADSTTESEFIAMVLGCKEAMFLKQLLEELGELQPKIELFCDNMSAMKLIQKKCINDRTKHISRKKLFVRQFIQYGLISLHYVQSKEMKADILTKALSPEKHEYLRREIGLDEI